MRTRVIAFCSAVMLALSTHAGIIFSSIPDGGYIPDGSGVALSTTATATGYLPSISDISVNLNVSGGYNGDLYAALSYGGVLVPLLNRVGVTGTGGGGGNPDGYATPGFNITLNSSGAHDIHFYQNYSPSYNGSGQLMGTWQPDGRAIDPQSSPATFDSASRVNFGSFNGINPNGTWTLIFADLSAGGQSRLVSWDLSITAAVPEPANVALGVFAAVFLVVGTARNKRVQQFLRQAFAR
jgi:hypothetical protein